MTKDFAAVLLVMCISNAIATFLGEFVCVYVCMYVYPCRNSRVLVLLTFNA